MLRRAMTLAVLATALIPLASADAAKTTSVKVLDCKSSDAAETRSATFLGRMRTIPGANTMEMRFTLLERFGDEKLHAVKTPDLRVWRQSKPGVKEFRFKQTVTSLQGGGQYRMRVDFRWRAANGTLLRRSRTVSSPCEQPGDLPNLRIGQIRAQAGTAGTTTYFLPVQNNGQITTGDFAVELFVDGAAANVVHVDAIEPGGTRDIRITGPACQRGLRAVADPGDSVKERFESDNVLKSPCPSTGG